MSHDSDLDKNDCLSVGFAFRQQARQKHGQVAALAPQVPGYAMIRVLGNSGHDHGS
jgi:hypothetical protein